MAIQQIISSLESLNHMHEIVLELGERKQHVLINNQIEELIDITNNEAKLMKQVTEQEQHWLKQMAQFAENKGLTPSPGMTMAELIELVEQADDKQALYDVQGKLLDTMAKLRQINTLNQQLIEQSLSYIDYNIEVMTGDGGQDMFYQNPTNNNGAQPPKARGGRSVFDTKA